MKKQKTPAIASREEAQAVMHNLTLATMDLLRFTGERDMLLASVNEDFADKISNCETAIKEKGKALHTWADANPDEFPKGVKSIEFATGTIGFRLNPYKLILLSRKWTWEKVLAKLKDLGNHSFIRTKEEVDKEAILKARNITVWNDEMISQFGCVAVQEEQFFVDTKLATVPTRQTVEAN